MGCLHGAGVADCCEADSAAGSCGDCARTGSGQEEEKEEGCGGWCCGEDGCEEGSRKEGGEEDREKESGQESGSEGIRKEEEGKEVIEGEAWRGAWPVEVRGLPLFARKKRRMGHPQLLGGSRVGHPAAILYPKLHLGDVVAARTVVLVRH